MVFRDWLDGQMGQRGISRRELARRLAAQRGGEFESYRRAVKRYLSDEPTVPSRQTREAICDALGADPADMPDPDDEDEDMFAALMLDILKLREKFMQLEADRQLERDIKPSYQRMMASLQKYQEPGYQRMMAALRKYERAAA